MDAAERERVRNLVRCGYDEISLTYRSDDGQSNAEVSETTTRYETWIAELAAIVPPPARVLDLGCGAGVPAALLLVDRGYDVVGADFSATQIARARQLVPGATFLEGDMVTLDLPAGSFDAVLSLYALIHVPRDDLLTVFANIRRWLRPGGYLVAIIGHNELTEVADYMGAPMFWDHLDSATTMTWLSQHGLEPVWDRFVPEGAVGHTLVLARATAM
jgi:SAM-dependent methyltransferase